MSDKSRDMDPRGGCTLEKLMGRKQYLFSSGELTHVRLENAGRLVLHSAGPVDCAYLRLRHARYDVSNQINVIIRTLTTLAQRYHLLNSSDAP